MTQCAEPTHIDISEGSRHQGVSLQKAVILILIRTCLAKSPQIYGHLCKNIGLSKKDEVTELTLCRRFSRADISHLLRASSLQWRKARQIACA